MPGTGVGPGVGALVGDSVGGPEGLVVGSGVRRFGDPEGPGVGSGVPSGVGGATTVGDLVGPGVGFGVLRFLVGVGSGVACTGGEVELFDGPGVGDKVLSHIWHMQKSPMHFSLPCPWPHAGTLQHSLVGEEVGETVGPGEGTGVEPSVGEAVGPGVGSGVATGCSVGRRVGGLVSMSMHTEQQYSALVPLILVHLSRPGKSPHL